MKAAKMTLRMSPGIKGRTPIEKAFAIPILYRKVSHKIPKAYMTRLAAVKEAITNAVPLFPVFVMRPMR